MGGLKKLSGQELTLRYGRYGLRPFDWIEEGHLMASVYPTGPGYLTYLRKVEGIELAVNLAEDEWPGGWGLSSKVRCVHVPITDMGIPSREQVKKVIDTIDGHDGPVMVHCAAGLGRTGTIIALYLAEKGLSGAEAIEAVRSKRSGSIQTSEQERTVLEWAEERRWRGRTQ